VAAIAPPLAASAQSALPLPRPRLLLNETLVLLHCGVVYMHGLAWSLISHPYWHASHVNLPVQRVAVFTHHQNVSRNGAAWNGIEPEVK